MTSPISDETLDSLKAERVQAEQNYKDAMKAVERAIPGAGPLPALDDKTLGLWATTPGDPVASVSGWRRRLAGFVWRLVGPMLQQQQQFNHVVAYHLAVPQTAFNSELMHGLQQIQLMVDAKDRETAATMHRYLSDGLSALADAIAKRWESMLARDQRYEARMSELADIRASIASLQQASHTIKRELERILAASATAAPSAPTSGTGELPTTNYELRTADRFDAYKYVGFEDQFRGSLEDIRARMGEYVSCFEGASDVLDVGCGRGEFLQLLGERGVKARGVDVNHEMVEACRAAGLDVVQGDALDYLASLPDGSLGGLFAAQVVEHLEPDRLIALLGVAFGKLRPGSRVVLETINPACWAAFFDSYIRDLTHVRPIHPDTLKYLLQASGFQAPEIRFRSPYPDFARLQPIAIPESARVPSADWTLVDVAETFNENVAKLNAKLFTDRDYAAIATRG